jgi:hypothetical protein
MYGESGCTCGHSDPCIPATETCVEQTYYVWQCGGGSTGGTGDGSTSDTNNDNGQTGGGDQTGGDNLGDEIPVVPITEDLRLNIFLASLDIDERAWWDNLENRTMVTYIKNFLIAEDYDELAVTWAKGQVELEVLAGNYNWVPSNGTVIGLKYTHIDQRGSNGTYFKLTDGAILFTSPFEQKLTRSGELKNKFDDTTNFDPNGIFYYMKVQDFEWAEVLYHPDSLFDGLKVLFELGAIDLGKSIGRYVLPIEDIKILIDGRDFDGNEVSRWQAAGLLLLAVVPGGKALRVVDDVIDAAQIAIKLHGGSMVIDLVQTGLRVVTNNGVTRFLSSTGDEIARLVDGVLTFRYTGFGGDLVTTANKTTTVIGKYVGGTKEIIESGLSRSGKNVGGFNVLNDPDFSGWITNKNWLDEAIERGDIIRLISDPSVADGFYLQEINYLISEGYQIVGNQMIKI